MFLAHFCDWLRGKCSFHCHYTVQYGIDIGAQAATDEPLKQDVSGAK